MWNVGCENVEGGNVKCWMWECEMWKVGFGMGHAAREYSPTDRR